MRIGEVIRQYRKEAGLTQEEMAGRLGVTAPAVNKWENGASCPDIQLLAPIARLLHITLDTLLDFRSGLTGQEIEELVKEVDRIFTEQGFEAGFAWIKRKLEEYPGSVRLAWQMALILDVRHMTEKIEEAEPYESFIMGCYARALRSEDEDVRYQAAESLYGFYLRKEKYEKAQEYLEYFPKRDPLRKQKKAMLYARMGQTEEAYRAYEELLFSYYPLLSAAFYGIGELAMKEERLEKAREMVRKQEELAGLLEMGAYYESVCRIELAAKEKDEEEMLRTATAMLCAAKQLSAFSGAPLYEHMAFKEPSESFVNQVREKLKKSLREDASFAFMKENPEWRALTEEG